MIKGALGKFGQWIGLTKQALSRFPGWIGRIGAFGAASFGAAGLAVIALAAYSFSLSNDQTGKKDDCQDAGLLSNSECERLHGGPADTLLVIAIALIGLAVLLVAFGVLAFRNRSQAMGEESSPKVPKDSKPVLRVCPVCSAQTKTASDTCPSCGSSYIRSRRVRVRKRIGALGLGARVAAGVAGLFVVGCIVGGLATKSYSDDQDNEAQNLAEEEIERQEAEQAAAEQEELELERSLRQALVTDMEKSITEDAQKESEQAFSIIEGPILDTQCDPSGGAIDVESRTQDFECLAITDYLSGGQIEGYNYSATADYEQFSFRWRLAAGGF